MSKPIKANYDQEFLLPLSIEDWVSKDHPARYIREFVESLDLKEMGFNETIWDILGGQGGVVVWNHIPHIKTQKGTNEISNCIIK